MSTVICLQEIDVVLWKSDFLQQNYTDMEVSKKSTVKFLLFENALLYIRASYYLVTSFLVT